MSKAEPRPVTPLDLPLVRRMITHLLPLDMTGALTNGISGMESAFLSAVPLADLGKPTIVLRRDDGGYVGQFQHRLGEPVARLMFVAPEPQKGDHTPDWTWLLEALTYEAGRRGAHLVRAEVPEGHPVFLGFRMAGYVVYSRQVILRRNPGPLAAAEPHLLRPAYDRDSIGITALYANTVPQLLQHAEMVPAGDGLVYERDGQLAGFLAIVRGRDGIVIKPYFHPEIHDQAATIVLSTLAHIPQAERLPVYLYVRAYQDWLRGILEQVEFESWTHQVLMVKYTVVRAQRPEPVSLPGLEASRLHPPVVDGPLTLRKDTHSQHRWSFWRRNGRRLDKQTPYGTSNNG
ncbi:MAG: hypothetical protein GYB65_14360 [Chloroflexi bacterium]|nr:hypothetical protein [Chloroflexota bacterium]